MKKKKRVVVKIGTAIFSLGQQQKSEGSVLNALVQEIGRARKNGFEFILVTSGAIGAGLKILQWGKRPDQIRKKQAAAAVGQVSLMQAYKDLFEHQNISVAQILLTRTDFEDRRKYLNARNTLDTLLEYNVVPVINENDTVATDEIQFGDNDQLSALVASKMDADLLLILSNVDGLLRSRQGESSEVVSLVPQITSEIERLAWQGVKSAQGTGGMTSKIQAAKIAVSSGVAVVMANATRSQVISDVLVGMDVGTRFLPMRSLNAKQKWILYGAIPKGSLVVDGGAGQALREKKKSLLPAGIVQVSGLFKSGDVVQILGAEKEEIARGVTCFSSQEVDKIKQHRSHEIAHLLNLSSPSEVVVHRDDMVLIPQIWK